MLYSDVEKQNPSKGSKHWLFILGALTISAILSGDGDAPTGFDQRSRGREYFTRPSLHCPPTSGGVNLPMEQHYLVDLYNVADESLALLHTGMIAEWTTGSQAHISFHSWPDRNFVAFDVHICGDRKPDVLVDRIVALLNPGRIIKTLVQRGDPQLTGHADHVADIPTPVDFNAFSTIKDGINPQEVVAAPHPTGSPILRTEDVCVNADSPGDDCMLLRSTHILAEVQSKFQRVEVVDTRSYGRCMLLDRIVQFCNADNHIYTSNIVDRALEPFAAITSDSSAISVQIVGGGDGWVASYILDKYPTLVRSVSLVDIDPVVSEMTRRHFAPAGEVNSFADPRVEWVFADAGKWLQEAGRPQSVEVAIIDCTDHNVGSSGVLYTLDFYRAVHRMLKSGGRVVQQMNVEEAEYIAFLQKTELLWIEAGFRNVVKWSSPIASFGGNAVFWMAEA